MSLKEKEVNAYDEIKDAWSKSKTELSEMWDNIAENNSENEEQAEEVSKTETTEEVIETESNEQETVETNEEEEKEPEETDEPEETEQKPNKQTIVYRGEEISVTEDELISLAQKGFDYTKKMQELSVHRDLTDAITKDEKLKGMVKDYLEGKLNPKQEEELPETIVDSDDVRKVVNAELKGINEKLKQTELSNLQMQQDYFDKQIEQSLTQEEFKRVQDTIENWVSMSSENEVKRVVNSNLTTYQDFIYNIIDRVKMQSKVALKTGQSSTSTPTTPKKKIQNYIEKPTSVTNANAGNTKEVDPWNMDKKELEKLLRKL